MIPKLNHGEIYVGRINDEHIILLPGDNDDADWQTQKEWAASIGGDLPTRLEQSLLWQNFRDQFQKDWHWSNEASEAGWAWCQDFYHGDQSCTRQHYQLRARAVRMEKAE
jgi:hypothetical protein